MIILLKHICSCFSYIDFVNTEKCQNYHFIATIHVTYRKLRSKNNFWYFYMSISHFPCTFWVKCTFTSLNDVIFIMFTLLCYNLNAYLSFRYIDHRKMSKSKTICFHNMNVKNAYRETNPILVGKKWKCSWRGLDSNSQPSNQKARVLTITPLLLNEQKCKI